MKKPYWFFLILVVFSMTNAQCFLYVNTAGDFDIGYKFKSIKPYVGISFYSYFERDYNTKADTLIDDGIWDAQISPNIGSFIDIYKKSIDVFGDIKIGTTIYTNKNITYGWWKLNTSLGIGVEKNIEKIGFSGELCATYSLSAYRNAPTIMTYVNEISLTPKLGLTYYF